ncbi:hypothetical protein A3Q56_06337 [Intoshia linei]|uniref:28S ribosomal protein S21, mitochondrial n=1 Tax=Intoshia linei TaxID=1819745 RepID=A0A177AVB4_9BILA|nr:hypothetical protein A3Q56_06337 [Intoshia linei]
MKNERVFDRARELIYFEKPTLRKRRWHYERCHRIYDQEMKKRIKFLMNVNRSDPYPW